MQVSIFLAHGTRQKYLALLRRNLAVLGLGCTKMRRCRENLEQYSPTATMLQQSIRVKARDQSLIKGDSPQSSSFLRFCAAGVKSVGSGMSAFRVLPPCRERGPASKGGRVCLRKATAVASSS